MFTSMKNLARKSGAGFTIIELLVVVAIIAVLAAIVLVNVTGYINQGKNAAVKGNLATILTNGAVYYDANGNYTAFCGDAYVTAPSAAVDAALGITAGTTAALCHPSVAANPIGANNAWCTCSTLKATAAEPAGSTFCVDSGGYKKVTPTACATRCAVAGIDSGSCID